MGFKPKFTKNQIAAQMVDIRLNIKRAILERLSFVGEDFVKMARSKTRDEGGFGDVTGNLRSSIGYVVLDHGRTAYEDYTKVVNGDEGLREAKKLIKNLSSEFPDGYALIVVAGMDYAAKVESKGKDVITGSSLIAEKMLKDAMKRLEDKVSKI